MDGRELPAFVSQILPVGSTREELRAYFDACHREINLSSILYMVANAEARIRADATERASRKTDALGKGLARYYNSRSEPWKVPFKERGILDEWKMYARTQLQQSSHVDAWVQAIGNFTTPLDIRHWVAHGRYWTLRQSLSNKLVEDVARATSDLMDALRNLANAGNITPFA